MRQVTFTADGKDSLLSLSPPIQKRIKKKLRWLADNFNSIRPQHLSGEMSHLCKLRVGNYRAIYKINRENEILYVLKTGHRRDIYNM